MGRFHVRTARPEDVVSIVRVANQAFLETARLTGLIGRGFAQTMADYGEWCFVAEDEDDGIIGFLVGAHSEDKATIKWIAVHPDYWDRGVGGQLLKAIEDKARREGLKIVETGTPFARGFYERYGFRCVEVQKALILELVGRRVTPPEEIQMKPLILDDLGKLARFMERGEYLRFLTSYFNSFTDDPEKALLGLDRDEAVGVVIGRTDNIYKDLVKVEYIHPVEPSYALSLLYGLVHLCSTEGLRWVGVRLPIQGISEEALTRMGWREAKLPTFWTRYRMRKELR
ncbi:hypothetical protein DRO55_00270 [Candidatus Bathyarchaeota archaeon]|nr:MAG: hypothetical protein DRO55_00270 [Candidatus Bathyarchaeota archaeon]